MKLKKLTSPCGIDCFNCQVYEENITEEMKNYLSSILKKSPEEIACKGCRVQGGCSIYPQPCSTLACVKDKNIDFCFECSKFPCEKLNPCKDQAEKYPHNLKIYNLCKISKIGLEKWSKEVNDIRKRYFEGKFVVGKGPVI